MALNIVDSLPANMHLYVGFNFMPTDQILLEHYLFNKLHALPYSRAVVFDFDLYGTLEPWDIWRLFRGVDGIDLYFFTKLKRSTNHSRHLSAHINRKIGLADGTWSGENGATPIFDTENDDRILGYCKRFRYENPQLLEHHGEWIMHEYSLNEKLIISNCPDSNYVLCRIRKNERPKRKAEKEGFSNPQCMKKRVMAPKINDMGENEKPKRKARKTCISSLQPIEQSIVANEITYNKPCELELTTYNEFGLPLSEMNIDQGINNVPYMLETNQNTIHDVSCMLEMTANQDTNDVPYMLEMTTDQVIANQGTNNVPLMLEATNNDKAFGLQLSEMTANKGTNNVPLMLEATNNYNEFGLQLSEMTTNQGINNVPCMLERTIDQRTTDVSCMLEMTANQGTNDVPYMPNMTNNEDELWVLEMIANQDTSGDVPYMLGMTTDQGTNNVSYVFYMINNDFEVCMLEMTTNQDTNDVPCVPIVTVDQGVSSVPYVPETTQEFGDGLLTFDDIDYDFLFDV